MHGRRVVIYLKVKVMPTITSTSLHCAALRKNDNKAGEVCALDAYLDSSKTKLRAGNLCVKQRSFLQVSPLKSIAISR